ncbi:PAQR family membrane homeostasis protein TrhA [Sinanaerobacter chloroacetimidivorans]|jgi:hemolysin III|uniref:Hemolysin III family protein n=1 Tax=Sinanaerobacter chloroacetimidivorans TaxID=2818044 RepID=A0A8J8B1I2_9FIRM|nr:hemolysin III family protein [Sinanaerobacter chloroacetimidivorans]MBR0597757.1 hemolysin III family protein [Sinanaerobacter chloroacetimidivorans]
MTNVENFNDQSLGEEIANAVSHGIGAVLAIAGTVILIFCAWLYSDTLGLVSASLYGFSLVFLYLMSTLYHSFTNIAVKRVFQVFDHCSVFILILGSYVPICLSLLGGSIGWTLFGINAFFTVLGITANAISVKKWHNLSLLLYLLMGWSVIIAIRPLLNLVPLSGFGLLLGGGLSYSIGVLFYNATRPHFMHSIWHLLVLCGSVLHYFFVLFYIIL